MKTQPLFQVLVNHFELANPRTRKAPLTRVVCNKIKKLLDSETEATQR